VRLWGVRFLGEWFDFSGSVDRVSPGRLRFLYAKELSMTLTTESDLQRKFEEMILLVARASEGDLNFGATKLNKILFYADFAAYRKACRSISGQVYQKLEHGPAPRRFLPVVQAMEKTGSCAWAERERNGFRQRRLLALREPDVSVFSAEEVQLIWKTVEDLRDLTGREVSDLSHGFVGWRLVDFGEEIPYGTVFVEEPRPLTAEEEIWAEEAIREYLAGEATVHR
jgi:hypothetical protein